MRKKAVIIIPTYNERENIQKIVPQIFAVVETIRNYQVDILVVDDTSPDKTYAAVKKMQAKFPRLHLLINSEKAGLGGAYLKGMAEAFGRLKADYIFEFDADGSHDPKKLPEFFSKLDDGYDFVIGGRYKNGGRVDPNWPFIRKFYSIVGNLVIMVVLTDFRIRDWTSGYRAISKKVYQAVVKEMQGKRFSGYTWQIGFLHKAVRKSFRFCEVPIYFKDRKIGESKLGSEYIKNTLIYIFKARAAELAGLRVFKFIVVGGVTAILQLIATAILEQLFRAQGLTSDNAMSVVQFIATELSIITNFSLNNHWTFRTHRLHGWRRLLPQFGKFNLSACGSIIIQQLVLRLGLWWSASWQWFFITPTLGYTAIGIILGMIWNYFAYSKFIWRTK
jgi:dolichol-phosphate mannosyltransferase